MNKIFWIFWLITTLAIGGFYGFKIFIDEDKEELLIGEATHGHFQIELSCSSCHTDAFGGTEVLQDACTSCHAEELKLAQDSHPLSKFRDPRNADRLAGLDARLCISCHTEHQNEQTHPMGLTIPEDYCYHCHQEIAEERPSHEGLGYETCASAGCHNYHDNRALYEPFLVKNAGGHWLNDNPHIPAANRTSTDAVNYINAKASSLSEKANDYPKIAEHWAASSHAEAGINCGGCHADDTEQSTAWIEKPGIEQCSTCHSQEAEGFLAGKHGMRMAAGLTAIAPAEGRLSFTEESLEVSHSCTGCHGAHDFNTEFAATEACLGCHNDEHSLAFESSPHALLSVEALTNPLINQSHNEAVAATAATQNVSCATCHMPRIASEDIAGNSIVHVEHNQNMNLRPNEKMIRPVCMQCHNLEFSINALADPALILNNFSGQPSSHIPSIEWALKEAAEHE